MVSVARHASRPNLNLCLATAQWTFADQALGPLSLCPRLARPPSPIGQD
ncbi:hypothetical protein SFOMI_3440 [Sphingobium fuliginis]|uniref:Uncharacterized protein n=1 Tax=Sphingobium fuliginis (strain ATCC 27551) TaxID=336203 RepID=A0A292ZIG0_SPHSA|nr:hypothetical protein SFOMI_3440 [Sphingobium fuliginis]